MLPLFPEPTTNFANDIPQGFSKRLIGRHLAQDGQRQSSQTGLQEGIDRLMPEANNLVLEFYSPASFAVSQFSGEVQPVGFWSQQHREGSDGSLIAYVEGRIVEQKSPWQP